MTVGRFSDRETDRSGSWGMGREEDHEASLHRGFVVDRVQEDA